MQLHNFHILYLLFQDCKLFFRKGLFNIIKNIFPLNSTAYIILWPIDWISFLSLMIAIINVTLRLLFNNLTQIFITLCNLKICNSLYLIYYTIWKYANIFPGISLRDSSWFPMNLWISIWLFLEKWIHEVARTMAINIFQIEILQSYPG